MKYVLLLLCGAALVTLHGCGPMRMPMPVRLDDESQKSFDQAWEKALTPVGRFNHQGLLDVFLLTQAYQAGVDKLTLRSEKKTAAAVVVMEIEFDRLKPEQDRFEVKIYDHGRKLLRRESYSRKEVEDTYSDLFVREKQLREWADKGHATPEDMLALAELQARHQAVGVLFPKDEVPDPDGKGKMPGA
jgi:hypothetical protein